MLPGVKGSGWGIEIPLGPFGSLLFPPSFLSLSIDCLHVCGNGAGAAELCLLSADFILVHQTRGFGVGWGGQRWVCLCTAVTNVESLLLLRKYFIINHDDSVPICVSFGTKLNARNRTDIFKHVVSFVKVITNSLIIHFLKYI